MDLTDVFLIACSTMGYLHLVQQQMDGFLVSLQKPVDIFIGSLVYRRGFRKVATPIRHSCAPYDRCASLNALRTHPQDAWMDCAFLAWCG